MAIRFLFRLLLPTRAPSRRLADYSHRPQEHSLPDHLPLFSSVYGLCPAAQGPEPQPSALS